MFIDIRNVIKAGPATNNNVRARHAKKRQKRKNCKQYLGGGGDKLDAADTKESVLFEQILLANLCICNTFYSRRLTLPIYCVRLLCVCAWALAPNSSFRMYPNYVSWKPGQIDLTLISSTMMSLSSSSSLSLLLFYLFYSFSVSVHKISIKCQAAWDEFSIQLTYEVCGRLCVYMSV